MKTIIGFKPWFKARPWQQSWWAADEDIYSWYWFIYGWRKRPIIARELWN